MKNMKKMIALFLACMLCGTMLLGACGNGTTTEAKEKEYKVTVKDALGNAYSSGIVVLFYQGDTQVAMQVCNENGEAIKTLETGDYTVKLQFTGDASGYYYDEEGLTLSADKTELDVVLAKAVNTAPTTLYAQGEEKDAYALTTGCTYVKLTAGERNYFLFTPTEAGTYQFSVEDGLGMEIGYYGMPSFVQSTSAAEVVDGKFTLSVSASMIGAGDGGTTVIVFGVDSTDQTDCVIGVSRIGDPEWSIEDEPWDIYKTTATLSKYTLPEGTTLKNFDLTADSYTLVYNETDGFYHKDSADGPLVYVYLTKDPRYSACYKTVLESTNICRYYFDENNKFIKRVSYNQCLEAYVPNADEKAGVYPLTEDLKTIIQNNGEYLGWWNASSPGFIFYESSGLPVVGLNPEIAWLFMCCYAE